MSVRVDAETLRNIPIFAECDPVHLQLLAFSSEKLQFEAGDVIMAQGHNGAAAHLILSGAAALQLGEGDKVEPAGIAGPGAFLGEVAMIGEMPYSLTARATTAVSAAKISRELFMRIAEEYPEFGAAVFKVLARKLDSSMSAFEQAQRALDGARSFSDL